jgi:hypothetical protein
MTKYRPDIPSPIKRAVRQKCGFGCVICGLAVYEYDHVIEWSEVQQHTVKNLILLCSFHHTEKTTGRLPIETLTRAAERPRNKRVKESLAYRLFAHGKRTDIFLGSIRFSLDFSTNNFNIFEVIVIKNKVMISIENDDDSLLLTYQ